MKEVENFFSLTCKGVNAFLIVMQVKDVGFDTPTEEILYTLTKIFGEKFWKHVIIVLTHCDKMCGRLIPGVEKDYDEIKSQLPKAIP